jgi:5-methylcytosine-specific restriction enzyme A
MPSYSTAMPWAPARQCPTPGCPRLLRPGERCPDHTPPPFATSTYRQRPTIPARLKRAILERDDYRCQLCPRPATEVDHVIPRSAGGTDHPSNLRAICHPCHVKRSGRQGRAAHRT